MAIMFWIFRGDARPLSLSLCDHMRLCVCVCIYRASVRLTSAAALTQRQPYLQPFFAPFVLTRLRCTGDEDRLADCPGLESMVTEEESIRFAGSRFCTGVSTGDAVVACGTGMDTEAGTLHLSSYSHPELSKSYTDMSSNYLH